MAGEMATVCLVFKWVFVLDIHSQSKGEDVAHARDQVDPSSYAGPSSTSGSYSDSSFPGDAGELERMRLQALGNPSVMNQLRQVGGLRLLNLCTEWTIDTFVKHDPSLARAIVEGGPQFLDEFMRFQVRNRDRSSEKERQIEVSYSYHVRSCFLWIWSRLIAGTQL